MRFLSDTKNKFLQLRHTSRKYLFFGKFVFYNLGFAQSKIPYNK